MYRENRGVEKWRSKGVGEISDLFSSGLPLAMDQEKAICTHNRLEVNTVGSIS